MDINKLKTVIDDIESTTKSKEWFDSLEDRKKEEAEYHDFSHDDDANRDNEKFYTTVKISKDYLHNWLKVHSKNKIFLDYACGNGMHTINAAEYGASLALGIDISPVSVENSIKEAKIANVESNTRFFVGDCENTSLPDDCIDTILCNGVLHHMNLEFVWPELFRILKPGGRILGVEALNYNPVIRAYRQRTPELRTEWEKDHILDLKDVKDAQKLFDLGELKFWHITSFVAGFFKKWHFLRRALLPFLNAIDFVLTKIPFVQRMAWQFTFELIKRK